MSVSEQLETALGNGAHGVMGVHEGLDEVSLLAVGIDLNVEPTSVCESVEVRRLARVGVIKEAD